MFSARELERTDPATLFRAAGVPRAMELAALVKPCVVLEPGSSRKRTRLGGLPDLPEGEPWPTTSAGDPMIFVGQLDLEELAPTSIAGELPDHGLMTWFYGPTGSEFAIGWSAARPVRRVTPRAGTSVLPEHGATLRSWWSIPSGARECPIMDALGLTDEERSRWGELYEEWMCHESSTEGHRVLGYAEVDEAYLTAALDTDEGLRARFFARAVSDRSRVPYRDADLAARASAFRLLVEIADLDELGISWGDGASTAILVHEGAWRRRDFNQRSPSRDACALCFRS